MFRNLVRPPPVVEIFPSVKFLLLHFAHSNFIFFSIFHSDNGFFALIIIMIDESLLTLTILEVFLVGK